MPVLDGTRQALKTLEPAGSWGTDLNQIAVTADSGFHSQSTLEQLEAQGVNAWIADRDKRTRDPRFAGRARYQQRHRKERQRFEGRTRQYTSKDFTYDPETNTCHCPAGHKFHSKGGGDLRGYRAQRFAGNQTICGPCPHRARCFKHPEIIRVRQVAIFLGKRHPEGPVERMKARIDSAVGQRLYDRRLPTVEPVFANQRNHRRDRFTLRGKPKVNTQWRLYSLVHNLGKAYASGGMAT